ncbi:classical arabinogalactan protein 7 [Drosophila rhopaloa]|uniref:Classical arabinogalactan protein 9 n=1 Tax=Drosophila rhopaloa TaxID=1041015 RepID=A0A6P4F9L8_DRORH|nr:classical arabinogalactan protein 7 [Drosophila rhopaloa]
MSPRRNILVALSCCLLLNCLNIQARSLDESAVKTKRDSSDWWSLLEDIIYEDSSDYEADNESYLVCRNCTVVVQSAPNATADGGTAAPPAGGTTPAAPVPVATDPPATSAPATSAPATSAPATSVAPAVTTAPGESTPTPTAASGG